MYGDKGYSDGMQAGEASLEIGNISIAANGNYTYSCIFSNVLYYCDDHGGALWFYATDGTTYAIPI